MIVPELLDRINSAASVQIISDNALRPYVAVSETKSSSPSSRPKSLVRRRTTTASKNGRGSTQSRWGNTAPPPSTTSNVSLPPYELGVSKPRRRYSVEFSGNESIQDPHIMSPEQEKISLTPGGSPSTKKRTLPSKSIFRNPSIVGSGISSLPLNKDISKEDPAFNRWDSVPASIKDMNSMTCDSVFSLRSVAAQTASLKQNRKPSGIHGFQISDELHQAPKALLSPPKKPIRRGSFDSFSSQDSISFANDSNSTTLSDTAFLLDEALRITTEANYECDPFGGGDSFGDSSSTVTFAVVNCNP